MPASERLTVFVSSTSEDLQDYREVAKDVVVSLGWHPEMMEHWAASARPTVDECLAKLGQCDVVLLLVAFKHGWVPGADEGGNGADSITALEHRHALECRIPVLSLLASEDTWPGALWERNQQARDRVEQFRTALKRSPVEFFDSERPIRGAVADSLPVFRAKVQRTLLAYKESATRPRSSPREEPLHLDYFDPACEGLIRGRTVPFVGMGVYGTGPLSSAALAQALLGSEPVHEHSLATIAEFREKVMGSREEFLSRLRSILDEQSAVAEPAPIHDLLVALPKPPFIVDATFDCRLEDRLTAAGQRCVVLSHIIRSLDHQNDGRILVMRPGEPPAIRMPTQIDVSDSECVVYRPLGSPSFHDAHPDLEIDTVVVTETDHVTFLSVLSSAGIPQRLTPIFRRSPLLFLGYGLDVWQYRLVVQVFQSVGGRRPEAVTRAVRIPDGRMEELSWTRLKADVIRMDPHDFARRVRTKGGMPDGTAGHVVA
jgi:hypothetical protein